MRALGKGASKSSGRSIGESSVILNEVLLKTIYNKLNEG